ncbi:MULTISPECIES: YoaH family protein [unclassified Brenneria]|uniref:YoaH family protein n=1 Tax=unclassified Brenneria TaxID=2634434 RepID=UPI0029C1265F|nr:MULTISPECIES: YoaH family protein [unclassified Brenneria]MDX5626761.1 YoaH family protein [Brenneria sp. L3-3Z]MDX5693889.1 YoaH family protein [Brenneria sp. L4-2C]MEE3661470.1 YoaH family protein [Brenneria sp. g21c3]
MIAGMPALTHEQQQAAVERIQDLMAQGMSSGQAIAVVAAEIRAEHQGDRVSAMFDDEETNEMDDDEDRTFDDGEEEEER